MLENVGDKAAADWTPRDHFVKATQYMLEVEMLHDEQDPSSGQLMNHESSIRIDELCTFAEIHTKLASIPVSNVTDNSKEDFRP